jgi:hypothetical protein
VDPVAEVGRVDRSGLPQLSLVGSIWSSRAPDLGQDDHAQRRWEVGAKILAQLQPHAGPEPDRLQATRHEVLNHPSRG